MDRADKKTVSCPVTLRIWSGKTYINHGIREPLKITYEPIVVLGIFEYHFSASGAGLQDIYI